MINTINSEKSFVITTHPLEGLINSDERLAKVKLAYKINSLIKNQDMKQQEILQLLDITQPKLLQIASGRLSGFTVDQLHHFLYALGMDVSNLGFKS